MGCKAIGGRYDPGNRAHRLARSACVTTVSLAGLVLVWWFLSVAIDRQMLPSPPEVWDALADLFANGDSMTGRSAWTYIGSSFSTFIKGFLLAFAVAFPLGLALGYFNLLREFASPAFEVLRPIAPVAWAPVFVILFGYQIGPMMVVFVGIFFPLMTSVIFGVRKIEPNWTDAAKTLGASPLQIFCKVVVPASIPYLMNGVKVGLGIGWMCIVSAELYASPVGGIGFYISNQASAGYWPGVFSGIFLVGVLGIATVGAADYLHRSLSKRMGVDAS
ncbi:MAG: ABC transporter permease [Candidatus Methanoplasma sp.]|jgi:NitT/TauT family transport system permease protein|nr:ABC transporter permease [Candidatus Methanoplasma sp.]